MCHPNGEMALSSKVVAQGRAASNVGGPAVEKPWAEVMSSLGPRTSFSGGAKEQEALKAEELQMFREVSQTVVGEEDDPFLTFGLLPKFDVDEEALRTVYFRLCREAVQDPPRLARLHRLYQTLMDPRQRFDAVCQALGLSLPPPDEALSGDILELSEACLNSATGAKELINEKRAALEREIQQAFEEVDEKRLSQLRLRLGYLWRMAAMISRASND